MFFLVSYGGFFPSYPLLKDAYRWGNLPRAVLGWHLGWHLIREHHPGYLRHHPGRHLWHTRHGHLVRIIRHLRKLRLLLLLHHHRWESHATTTLGGPVHGHDRILLGHRRGWDRGRSTHHRGSTHHHPRRLLLLGLLRLLLLLLLRLLLGLLGWFWGSVKVEEVRSWIRWWWWGGFFWKTNAISSRGWFCPSIRGSPTNGDPRPGDSLGPPGLFGGLFFFGNRDRVGCIFLLGRPIGKSLGFPAVAWIQSSGIWWCEFFEFIFIPNIPSDVLDRGMFVGFLNARGNVEFKETVGMFVSPDYHALDLIGTPFI